MRLCATKEVKVRPEGGGGMHIVLNERERGVISMEVRVVE